MSRTALIVGAGIGGLSAGIALRQAGWNIRIFERAASPRELGFGLGLAPTAIAALRELGVADAVLARAWLPTRAELRRMDGTVLKRVNLPSGGSVGPTAVVLRPALHGALLDAVGLDAISLATEVTGFSTNGGRVTLHTGSGEVGAVVEGDLLIGADGVRSIVRERLHPSQPPPRSSRIVAVRGAVHGVTHCLGDCSAVAYLGPGVESMLLRASDTGIYWFLSVARELAPDGVRDPAAVLAHFAPAFDATFRAVTSATDDLRYDELVDRDPLPFWGKGCVTLLGDAAHPLLPQTGQGAAQAMVDAVTLGRTLRHQPEVERALRSYEQQRRDKTAALLARGRRIARIMRTMNPVACYIRELAVRLIPVAPIVRILARTNRSSR